ncbi:site-specific DNA-methyltransferase [Latilactobacillus sakei]|uniref:site-specific DNA-methyltransferase n=1 Tax=Latilactobacillus sakei TaxID=1599 RepID=UPI001BD201EF|nr:site-specific DNA-methyltransferase [Latilactobacillus sakei]QVQ48324.1 site-specific DNA-methyltransferase [Latilactobacillus sakei subsp. sakei]
MVDFKQILTEDNTEPNTAFLNQLRNKLPEFFTKDKYDIDAEGNEVLVEAGGFDIQKFQDSLRKHNVNEITDGYTLNFVGKKYAELQTGKSTTTVVIPDVKHNEQPKNAQSENVFLTGNNLDVLKHLQRAYTNSIDVIYIDPPYNTGDDGFTYNDKFDLSDEDLRDTLNMSQDEIKKLRLLDGRSSHSAWLTFMYPRLRIAQQLLKDIGIIFVSIDENEYADTEMILSEIFGEMNLAGTIVWDKRNPKGDAKGISMQHEYIIAVTKNINVFSAAKDLKRSKKNAEAMLNKAKTLFKKVNTNFSLRDANAEFSNWIKKQEGFSGGERAYSKIDEHGNVYQAVSMTWPNNKQAPDDYFVPVIHPKTKKPTKIPEKGWRYPSETLKRMIQDDMVIFGEDETTIPRSKYLLSENMTEKVPSLYYNGSSGSSDLTKLGLTQTVFDNPKPVDLLKQLIESTTKNDEVILDFFAGSGTTAEAVMQLNAKDGGNRKWILNTLDEKISEKSAASATGYLTIDEISRERIKRSGEKIKKEHPELERFDDGFKHYYVKEIDANTIDKIVEFDPNSIQILTEDVVSEFAGNAVKLGEYYEKSDKDKINPKFAKVVDTGATGEDTILQTWLINDGYKLDIPVKTLELVHHNVHYVEDGAMAYIIDQFTQEDVEALLNLIGTQQLNVKTIIVFGYSFDFSTMTSLKNNVKTALDGVRVEVRY